MTASAGREVTIGRALILTDAGSRPHQCQFCSRLAWGNAPSASPRRDRSKRGA
jgi:hypothetical protein